MVIFDVTPAMMAAGAQLLTLLAEARIKVDACAWVLQEEVGRWRLILSSPTARLRGERYVYRAIFKLSAQIPDGDEVFRPGMVHVRSDRDPLATSVRKLAPRLHGKAARRLDYTWVDNTVFDAVYLYRVETAPAPKRRRSRRARPA